MKRFLHINLTLCALAALMMVSCKKEEAIVVTTDQISVENNRVAEEIFVEVFNQVVEMSHQNLEDVNFNQAAKNISFENNLNKPALNVAPLGEQWPKAVVANYGSASNRKGIFNCEFHGLLKNAGTVINIRFENYITNNLNLNGTLTITNAGRNYKGNLVFSLNANQVTINEQGKSFVYNSKNNVEWLEGDATATLADNTYSFTGNSFGKNINGEHFSFKIIRPLIKKGNFAFVTSGVIENTLQTTTSVDYGNGAKDNKAILATEISTKEINLSQF